MNNRMACALLALFAQTITSAVARADVPACPAWLGGYVATVDAGSVIVCPTTTNPPGYPSTTTCPFETGMVRVNVSTGYTKLFLGPCVADPSAGSASDAGTPCFLDPCVPPGTYEYGYQIPKFAGCTNNSCAGPTSGEWATVVTVSSSACVDDAGPTGPLPLSLALWRDVDAAVVDGAVPWSATCTGPLPGPDGGYCAWRWLDGSAQWAPCPPDGGTLCPAYTTDGTEIPIPCPNPVTAGFGGAGNSNGANGTVNDAGGTAGPAEAPAPAKGSSDGGGGCSVSPGERGTASAYAAALASLSLALTMRRRRRPSRRPR
jgi:MYXO-CTERM domain-containing protein